MSSVTITTNVTISTSVANALDVEDHGAPVSVPQETDATNLVWQLTGNAAQGSFNTILDPTNPNYSNSGFSWIDFPPSGIFGSPTLAANGNQVTVTDSNSSNGSTGSWRYKLCATINGSQYCTTSSVSTRGTTNDPMIKNN
jgi:hypothetical protein